jgi:ubiquinone/menaquinone biosynthesis C-methylase UbiE
MWGGSEVVGKNNGKVICVDLLDSALSKLMEYSKQFKVEEVILPKKADIGNYEIKSNEFDFIVAVSSLEHIQSEEIFDKVVQQMAAGTKSNGINCIIVNSEVVEIDTETNENLDALMEINIATEDMINKLENMYEGWEVLTKVVKPLEYQISRNDRSILLKTNAITFIVQKPEKLCNNS